MRYYSGHPDQHYGHITYSQHGEDLLILNLFDQLQIKNPSYLDLGAHHPTDISNTKLLYDRGSRGVNIEANRHLIEAFYEQRPLDKNVHVGVYLNEGHASLFMHSKTSGRNSFSHEELEYVKRSFGMIPTEFEEVQTKTLKQIVDQYCGGYFPEFLNCDIEGLDFEILSHADFQSTSPIIICVETRDAKKMCAMMREKNFYPYCQLDENLIFIRDLYFYTLTKKWNALPSI